jgi:hypothetical protein
VVTAPKLIAEVFGVRSHVGVHPETGVRYVVALGGSTRG